MSEAYDRVRRMTADDVDAVEVIERATFASPWSRDALMSEMTTNVCARYLVAEKDGAVIGYAGAWIVLDEAHITNVAVSAAHRGQGVGNALMAALMQYAANLGAAYMTLEVRRSNLTAQKLYAAHGFVQLGVRKRYYEDNREDAFLMVCDHLPDAEAGFAEAETVSE